MNILEMHGISKTFGKTKALKEVDFELRPGEVLSLLGENGAGKTTLMRVLYGMYTPDCGEILYEGKPVEFHRPIDAIQHGICMVHQHFMLVPFFSVTEKLCLLLYSRSESMRNGFLHRKQRNGNDKAVQVGKRKKKMKIFEKTC